MLQFGMSRYVMRVKEELQSSSSFTLITTRRMETYLVYVAMDDSMHTALSFVIHLLEGGQGILKHVGIVPPVCKLLSYYYFAVVGMDIVNQFIARYVDNFKNIDLNSEI